MKFCCFTLSTKDETALKILAIAVTGQISSAASERKTPDFFVKSGPEV